MDDRFLFHLRERNSWPRVTKLRHKCLIRQLDRLVSEADDQKTLRIHVRFEPFERVLLQRTLDYPLVAGQQDDCDSPAARDSISDIDADVAGTILFFRWSWADNVLRQALTELDRAWVAEAHDGSLPSAIEVYRKQLRTRMWRRNDLYDRRFYRTERLLLDNPHLVEAAEIDAGELTITPHHEDLALWRKLGAYVLEHADRVRTFSGFAEETIRLLGLYRCGSPSQKSFLSAVRERVVEAFEETLEFPPQDLYEGIRDEMDKARSTDSDYEVENVDDEGDTAGLPSLTESGREVVQNWAKVTAKNILDAEHLWDVWSWCRAAQVSTWNRQFALAGDSFIASEDFTRYWKVDTSSLGNRRIVSTQPFTMVESLRLSEIAGLLFKEGPQEYLDVEFRRQLHSAPLPDPLSYLRFVPWTALMDVGQHELEEQLEAGLGLSWESLPGTVCAFTPESATNLDTHILYLTDDLFAPHIESGYRHPAYTLGNRVVFLRQKLQDTLMVRQLGLFWELWNDCAITLDPDTSVFYLLQTLSGLKARELEEKSGIWSAFEFFDNRHRHRDSLLVQQSSLRDMLGSRYNPAYSDFLQYVDPCELDLSKDGLSEIGKGAFGRVYKVKWTKKPVKVYDHVEETPGAVALKVAMGCRTRNIREEFFVELATTYSALAGDSSGCIPFYGFSTVKVNAEGHIITQDTTLSVPEGALETFALIFDYADRGNLEDFLKESLERGKPMENWLVVCGALSSLANGLMTIHRKGVVHRDIHIRNALVQTISFLEAGEIEFDCLLSDLGEGKTCIDEEPSSSETGRTVEGSSRSSNVRLDSPPVHSQTVSSVFDLAKNRRPTPSAKSADILLWGTLAITIINDNLDFLRDEKGRIMYPATLMRVLERCIDPNPAGRLDATSLVTAMDEVLDGPAGLAAGEETEWYDDSYDFPRERVKPVSKSDYDMGSSWLKSVETGGWS